MKTVTSTRASTVENRSVGVNFRFLQLFLEERIRILHTVGGQFVVERLLTISRCESRNLNALNLHTLVGGNLADEFLQFGNLVLLQLFALDVSLVDNEEESGVFRIVGDANELVGSADGHSLFLEKQGC